MVEFKTQKIFHVILKEGVGGWGGVGGGEELVYRYSVDTFWNNTKCTITQ